MHLSVLYSSPLGYEEADSKGGTKFKPLQPLSFEKDIDQIKKSLENSKNRANYSIKIATPMNFISSLSKNPYILHFIGHGIKTSHFYKKEDYLVLENDDGSGQLISPAKLKMIIDVCNSKLDTVFLSFCYSESEADVFLRAGANHVICIQRDKKVKDAACIIFSSAFYTALFSEGKTPWESFNIAKQTLNITQSLEGQSALFIMKTKASLTQEHQCKSIVIFNGPNPEKTKATTEIRLEKNIPAPVESFIGRNQDVCMVLRELKDKRLITLTGEPGIGKTAVAKFIANYIKTRKGEFMRNGVMFLNAIYCSSTQMLKHKFVNAFKDSLGQSISRKADKKDTEMLFNEVLEVISKLEFLLIIDDAEDLLRTSKKMLKDFIESLFEASSTIRVLITSKIDMISFLGGINGVKGGSKQLKNLSQMASEKLLSEKAGRNITREEKNKLLKMEPRRVHGGVKNAYQHLFDVILSGHPIAIGLAANIFSTSSLEFLYETLSKSNLMNTLAQGTIGKATINEKIRFSLNLTLRVIKDKDVLIFFNLMGFFPGGTVDLAINDLWPQVKKKKSHIDWKQYFHFLQKASFMTKKKVKVNKEWKEVYFLVPMLKNLAEESRTPKMRKKVHKWVTTYFVDILEDILSQNSTDVMKNEDTLNILWHHEMNIWDCIYRALDIKKYLSIQPNKPSKPSKYLKNEQETPPQTSTKVVTISQEDRAKIEEESGPLDDSDYEMLFEKYKEDEENQKEISEDNIISDIIEHVKSSVIPKRKKKEIKDGNLLRFLTKTSNNSNNMKMVGKKVNFKNVKEAPAEDFMSGLKRNIDKNLKKTVNSKMVDLIKNNKELNSIDKPKEELYRKIAHKIFEAQEEHNLYIGEATATVTTLEGKKVKQVSYDARILILYVSNLVLFSKKTDALNAMEDFGKYFYDKNLWEANLRRLRGLTLMNTKIDLNLNGEAVQEFLEAKLIFEQTECDHGQAQWCAAIGYLIYEYVLHFPGHKIDLLNYAKKKFIEALTFYEHIGHKYGMSYCYDMLHEIKRSLGESANQE